MDSKLATVIIFCNSEHKSGRCTLCRSYDLLLYKITHTLSSSHSSGTVYSLSCRSQRFGFRTHPTEVLYIPN